jgi:hypothetical protein
LLRASTSQGRTSLILKPARCASMSVMGVFGPVSFC